MLLQAATTAGPGDSTAGQRPSGNEDHYPGSGAPAGGGNDETQQLQDCSRALHVLDYAPAPGWTVHVTKEGRLYYCNHVTRTAGWLPPAEAWKAGDETLPYGWERAVDDSGRPYYINHVNKTTTYETPVFRGLEPLPKPEPRSVTLERSPSLGFGFVAGSEKPVVVRFVTEGGPSVNKLLPGDQILSVNGEDVKSSPREHVISMVRSCTKTVNLVVCQPPEQQGVRKSTLLSATKRARLKSKPSRVRFAESVCVNGAPLFPPSAFSLGDLCVPPMANVLKVFLENGQTKSFKYDAWTTVKDVVASLQSKLCIQATEHFSLVVEHIKSLKRNKLTLLDPQDTLARIASRPGAHKLRCLFRVAFVPSSAAALAQRDLNALDYLYIQCCNDVIQERFAPELQYDTALRLAALHIYQHALANNIPAGKLTVKVVEKEFGLERFVPASILENMKRKEVCKLVGHFLKLHASMTGPGKQLTALQAKLHYLDIVSQLPSYGAKCFSAGPRGDAMERVILVSPKFGISQITGTRNSVFQPIPIASLEDMRRIEVRSDDEVTRTVFVKLQNDKILSIPLEERDAIELVLVLRGYFLLCTNQILPVDQEEAAPMEDLAPPYLSQHRVVPEKWSYIDQSAIKSVCFSVQPIYRGVNKKTNGLYNTMGRQSKPPLMFSYSLDDNMNNSLSNRNHQYDDFSANSYDFQSVVSMEILENGVTDAKNAEVLKRVQEMQQLVEDSEKYLTEQENLERLQELSEWQETSVDVESDTDEPGKLKHSDSLLLLTKGHHNTERRPSFSHATIELLRQEVAQSESDTESLYTPNSSPKHRKDSREDGAKLNRVSFGLRSPDNSVDKDQDFQTYLQRVRDLRNNDTNEMDSISEVNYIFDPDIIDLTMIPPPVTPDELDCALPVPINMPPKSFADSMDKLNRLEEILENSKDLDEFLANVAVPPPTQKVTPAVELTPEEIMAYIIPPPPSKASLENLVIAEEQRNNQNVSNQSNGTSNHCQPVKIRNSNSILLPNVIEYSTVDRKGTFSCCGKTKVEKAFKADETVQNDDVIKPPPRRSSDEKPPERPPKIVTQERQRSHSLTSTASKGTTTADFPPPKLPPRGDNSHPAPSHLFLPPKKPPLPPVPPLDVLRQKKTGHHYKAPSELRTASIGSPHLQRNKSVGNESDENADTRLTRHVSSAVSTPTSPHLGRNAQLSTVDVHIESPCNQYTSKVPGPSPFVKNTSYLHNSYDRHIDKRHLSPRANEQEAEAHFNGDLSPRNVCNSSTRENLLAKTDVAMAGLLVRLDQVAAQCTAAQVHGGGKLISEEKFQLAKEELTTQCLQLVTSSKMLVIAMSDPTLPDLPENLAICLTILRRLTELCQDLSNHTTAPLQTRNLILKVHDVTATFRYLITANIDRSSQKSIEEHLAAQAESLANVLATLLRSLRVFSP
ncbi:FERM and PDZ domain-containing protein 4 [Cylas formicarius]|uniref:FERM and PDZ domain-containing protein 4 n=1 Tax=Cylas formicarius TaxID=197179 RepID=UPI0029585D1A|nr:FERM and PDZ domain-containing protein 4 [Cylas formicarius]